ncbi:hydrogenase assembly protein HupF [Candidatus Bathyarchaeota archaeon]|nr:hydrogenase assembly protein HupF [Candidatus Bathyarchaeota archaeon]
MGKLGTEDLKRLLSCIKKDPRVVVSPQLGFDAGVHLIDKDKYLVVSTDPCIGVPEEWFGWLLVHYVASDVALFGAKIEFCTINLLGAPSTEPDVFHKVMRQACDAANKLGITIVTGHTGTYEGLSTLLGVCTGYGHVDKDRLVTPGDAKPGDHVVCIKTIGLEAAVNFALTHGALAEKLFGVQRTRELTKLVTMQSCVKEALLLAEIEGVHAMHDATEGGLTAALNEIAEASSVGFKVEWKKIPIPEEAHRLREAYRLSDEQVLSMSSTGTFLAAVSPEARDKVETVLRQNGVEARLLGSFTKDLRRVLVKNGKERLFPREADDPYARFLSEKL